MSDEEKRPELEQDPAPERARENGSAETGGEISGVIAEDSGEAIVDERNDSVSGEPVAQESKAAKGHGHDADHDRGTSGLPDHGHSSHGDDSHGHSGHGPGGHDEHFAHTTPKSLLIGVLVALILLTVLTVGVTAIDLGSRGNFVVAMVIATVKAALVMAYFMHMVWDSKFNVVAFTSSFLFVLLFLAMAVTDRSEYQQDLNVWEADQKVEAGK